MKSFNDEWKYVRGGVFLDIKAFNKVWEKVVILKIKQNDTSGNLLRIIEDLIENRYQKAVLKGQACGSGCSECWSPSRFNSWPFVVSSL